MNIMRFFRIACIAGLFQCASFSANSQNQNCTLGLNSPQVVNNAVAMRENNGTNEYIMMPSQYDPTIADWQLMLVKVDEFAFQADTIFQFPVSMNGVVVNDIATDPTGNIYFAGERSGVGVWGKLNANGTVAWVKSHPQLMTISTVRYIGTNAVGLILSGISNINNVKKVVSFAYRLQTGTISYKKEFSGSYQPSCVVGDVFIGNTALQSYGVTIARSSADTLMVFAYSTNNLSSVFSQTSSQVKKIALPSSLEWHETGASVVALSSDRFVIAISVRSYLQQKDGILLIKMRKTATNIDIVDNKLLYFPSPKLLVKDLVFVDDPNYDDVSINVIGQYVDTYCGSPFITKIDTNFLNPVTLTYGTAYPAHIYRNFRLEKGLYNYDQGNLVVVGSYNSYGNVYPNGGLYLTTNAPGVSWNAVLLCEDELNLSQTTCALTETTGTVSNSALSSSIQSFPLPISMTDLGDDIFQEDCNGKGSVTFKEKRPEKRSAKVAKPILFTSDNTNLFFENLPENCSYSIYSVMGSEIANGSLCNSSIKISSLKPGVYMLHIVQANQVVFSSKFVKY